MNELELIFNGMATTRAIASSTIAWLVMMAALPLAVVVATHTQLANERLRQVAIFAATTLVVVSSLGLVSAPLSSVRVMPPIFGDDVTTPLLRVDAFSNLLLPFVAVLWLLTLASTPRSRLDPRGLRTAAWSTLLNLIAFATTHPLVLTVAWILSTAVYVSALRDSGHGSARRVAVGYLGASSVLFCIAVGLLFLPLGVADSAKSTGMWLLIVSAMIRKGIFPFHAWLPEVFEHGKLEPTILFSAPQMGAYATAVLVVPTADALMLRVVAISALLTAVYGAALTLAQRDARRACGYLFVSQSALVMAGLDCTSQGSLAGALIVWLSSGIGFTGLACCVAVLEARRGPLDLAILHGGYERMPLLAASFLLLGLCCTGFPGTIGFVGEELLVDGATRAFPILGFAVVGAGALTGLAVLRMYFALFCGRRDAGVPLELLTREAWAFGLAVGILVITGLVPAPLVASRARASELLSEASAKKVSP